MPKPTHKRKSVRSILPKLLEPPPPLDNSAQQAPESAEFPDRSPDFPSGKPSSGVLSLEAAIDFSQASGNRQNANQSNQ